MRGGEDLWNKQTSSSLEWNNEEMTKHASGDNENLYVNVMNLHVWKDAKMMGKTSV